MIFFRRIPDRTRNFVLFTAKGVSVVAGIFTFAVSVLMVADYLQLRSADPLDAPALTALRDRYAVDPNTSEIAEDVRALDLLARKAYFTRTWQIRIGGYLLLGGSAVLIAALRLVALFQRAAKVPDGAKVFSGRRISRHILVAVGVVFIAGAFATSLLSRSFDTPTSLVDETSLAADSFFPDGYEINWPGFRGPYGNGRSFASNTPTEWDGPSGLNIAWSVAAPAPGFSSPVVWDDLVFLTGATEDSQLIFCFDAEDGVLLWERRIGPFPGSPAVAPRVTDDTGYAAPTPATDGKQVYVMFATGDAAAIDFGGNIVWGRNMGVPDNHYGHSSSLIAGTTDVIVLYDHAASAALYSLDPRTGLERWKTEREVETNWSSPSMAKIGDAWAVLVNANPYFAAYSADDGSELYRYEGIFGEVASSPAYNDDRVFVVNQIMSIVALDLIAGAAQWELYDDLPDATSPLVVESNLYIATSFGTITSTDTESGEVVWRAEFDYGFYSTPIYAGGFVYGFDRSGVAHIIEPADEYREVSTPALGEGVDTTPAIVEGRIFVRGENSLVCIATTVRDE